MLCSGRRTKEVTTIACINLQLRSLARCSQLEARLDPYSTVQGKVLIHSSISVLCPTPKRTSGLQPGETSHRYSLSVKTWTSVCLKFLAHIRKRLETTSRCRESARSRLDMLISRLIRSNQVICVYNDDDAGPNVTGRDTLEEVETISMIRAPTRHKDTSLTYRSTLLIPGAA